MVEAITGGWCEGDTIVDNVIIDRRTGKPAFESEFNDRAVRQLREAGFTQEEKQ